MLASVLGCIDGWCPRNRFPFLWYRSLAVCMSLHIVLHYLSVSQGSLMKQCCSMELHNGYELYLARRYTHRPEICGYITMSPMCFGTIDLNSNIAPPLSVSPSNAGTNDESCNQIIVQVSSWQALRNIQSIFAWLLYAGNKLNDRLYNLRQRWMWVKIQAQTNSSASHRCSTVNRACSKTDRTSSGTVPLLNALLSSMH